MYRITDEPEDHVGYVAALRYGPRLISKHCAGSQHVARFAAEQAMRRHQGLVISFSPSGLFKGPEDA